MNTKRNNIAQFIPSAQSKKDAPDYQVPEEFVERILYHPDTSAAANLVAQQTALTFDHDNKSKIEQMKVEQDELNNAYQSSRALHDDLVKKKANTKPIVKRYLLIKKYISKICERRFLIAWGFNHKPKFQLDPRQRNANELDNFKH